MNYVYFNLAICALLLFTLLHVIWDMYGKQKIYNRFCVLCADVGMLTIKTNMHLKRVLLNVFIRFVIVTYCLSCVYALIDFIGLAQSVHVMIGFGIFVLYIWWITALHQVAKTLVDIP